MLTLFSGLLLGFFTKVLIWKGLLKVTKLILDKSISVAEASNLAEVFCLPEVFSPRLN